MAKEKTAWFEQEAAKERHINEWDALIKQAGLHIKWPEQIAHCHYMTQQKLETKLLKTEQDYINYPGYYAKLYVDQGMTPEEAEAKVAEDAANASRRVKRAQNILALCEKEYAIRAALEERGEHPKTPAKYRFQAPALNARVSDLPSNPMRNPIGTTYYIDADSGNDSNDGLSAGAAWKTAAQYTTTSVRTAGDIAICKRATTAAYWTGDTTLNFDEDGTIAAPIILRSAYENEFSDDVDLSSTATATLVWGSKEVVFSADVSGVISAGDWIYNPEDDPYLHAYLVLGVNTNTVTIAWPYQGENPGAGKAMIKMLSAAPFGGTSASAGMSLSSDDHWWFQGIRLKTNATSGGLQLSTSASPTVLDIDGEVGAGLVSGIVNLISPVGAFVNKVYSYNGRAVNSGTPLDKVINIAADLNNKAQPGIAGNNQPIYENIELSNVNGSEGLVIINGQAFQSYRIRNLITDNSQARSVFQQFFAVEDFNNNIDNFIYTFTGLATPTEGTLQYNDAVTREGGAPFSVKVSPTTSISSLRDISCLTPVKGLPIFCAADVETTLRLYVRADDSAEWIANPTAAEIGLRAEYYGNPDNCYRRTAKSAEEPDFLNSEDWLALSVTFTPARDGLVYVSLLYGKPKETDKENIFYVDPFIEVVEPQEE